MNISFRDVKIILLPYSSTDS